MQLNVGDVLYLAVKEGSRHLYGFQLLGAEDAATAAQVWVCLYSDIALWLLQRDLLHDASQNFTFKFVTGAIRAAS